MNEKTYQLTATESKLLTMLTTMLSLKLRSLDSFSSTDSRNLSLRFLCVGDQAPVFVHRFLSLSGNMNMPLNIYLDSRILAPSYYNSLPYVGDRIHISAP